MLKRVEEALIAGAQISCDAGVNRQDRGFVVGVRSFDLTGERRNRHEFRFGLENRLANQPRDNIQHRFRSDETIAHGETLHGVVGRRRMSLESAIGNVDRFKSRETLGDRVAFIHRHDFRRPPGRPGDRRHHIHGFARADRPHREGRRRMFFAQGGADLRKRQERPFHRLRRDVEIAENRIERA